jgi:hypothetical protein
MRLLSIAGLCVVLAGLATSPSHAAARSTSTGQVSVAQLVEALQGAEADSARRQMLTAYLAGLGETVGVMIGSAGTYGASISCQRPLALDVQFVTEAIRQSAGSEANWGETAATPILVAAIVERAGCK